MAGQAGWYRAPGEDGLLRYWNGTLWTEHRQPDPALIPAAEPASVAEDLDPMAEYERQFAAPAAPQYRPQGDSGTPVVAVPEPEFAASSVSAPWAPPPSAVVPPAPEVSHQHEASESEFDRVFNEMSALAAQPDPAPVAAPVASTPLPQEAPAAAVVAPNRKAVLGAVKIMVIAVGVIILGVAAMVVLSLQSSAGPGQATTTGIVTSLGNTSAGSCTPIARFAVAGKSYTTGLAAAISPCPIGLGQSVDVVYRAAGPATGATIDPGDSVGQFLWMVPIAGGLVFVGGLIVFIIRAGSIVAGVKLLRSGRDRTKRTAAASV